MPLELAAACVWMPLAPPPPPRDEGEGESSAARAAEASPALNGHALRIDSAMWRLVGFHTEEAQPHLMRAAVMRCSKRGSLVALRSEDGLFSMARDTALVGQAHNVIVCVRRDHAKRPQHANKATVPKGAQAAAQANAAGGKEAQGQAARAAAAERKLGFLSAATSRMRQFFKKEKASVGTAPSSYIPSSQRDKARSGGAEHDRKAAEVAARHSRWIGLQRDRERRGRLAWHFELAGPVASTGTSAAVPRRYLRSLHIRASWVAGSGARVGPWSEEPHELFCGARFRTHEFRFFVQFQTL